MATLDPTKLECRGVFGYGTGHYIAESHAKMRASGEDVPGYCDRCPIKQQCWDEHKARIDAEYPVQVEAYKREQQLAAARGIPANEFAAAAMAAGYPDPYLGSTLENMQRAAKERYFAENGRSTRAERRKARNEALRAKRRG